MRYICRRKPTRRRAWITTPLRNELPEFIGAIFRRNKNCFFISRVITKLEKMRIESNGNWWKKKTDRERIKNLDTGFELVETNASSRCFYRVSHRKLKIDLSLFPFQRSQKHVSLWTTRRNTAIIQTLRKTSSRAHPTRVIFSFQDYVNLAISKKVCGHRPVIFFLFVFYIGSKDWGNNFIFPRSTGRRPV